MVPCSPREECVAAVEDIIVAAYPHSPGHPEKAVVISQAIKAVISNRDYQKKNGGNGLSAAKLCCFLLTQVHDSAAGKLGVIPSHIRICSRSELTKCTPSCRKDTKSSNTIFWKDLDSLGTKNRAGGDSELPDRTDISSQATQLLRIMAGRSYGSSARSVQSVLVERGLLIYKPIATTVYKYIAVPPGHPSAELHEHIPQKRSLSTPDENTLSIKRLKSTEDDAETGVTKNEFRRQLETVSAMGSGFIEKVKDLEAQVKAKDTSIQEKDLALKQMNGLRHRANKLEYMILPQIQATKKELETQLTQGEEELAKEVKKREEQARDLESMGAANDIEVSRLKEDLAMQRACKKGLEAKLAAMGRVKKLLGELASLSKDFE